MGETAGRKVTRSVDLVDGKEARALLMKGGALQLGDITGRITMQEVACPQGCDAAAAMHAADFARRVSVAQYANPRTSAGS